MNAQFTPAGELKAELNSGERLLWAGQPRQGIVFRASELFAIPFSIMWGGFAIFWEWSVLQGPDAPVFFALWGIPFVLVGLYLIVGRFFVDARQRAHTIYGVTNERILIVSGVFGRKVKSLNIRNLSDLSLSESPSGQGVISFGGTANLSSPFGEMAAWPGMTAHKGPSFELIPNARDVYEIIRGAQRVAA